MTYSRAATDAKYDRSEKGRARHARYNQSEKGRKRAEDWYWNLSGYEYNLRLLKGRRAKALSRVRKRRGDAASADAASLKVVNPSVLEHLP